MKKEVRDMSDQTPGYGELAEGAQADSIWGSLPVDHFLHNRIGNKGH